jgi:hypothetical protein
MPSYTFKLEYGLILPKSISPPSDKVAAVWQTLETAIQMTISATLGLELGG